MSALRNDLFLRALHRQPTPRTPVWLMRQAGRYLPEYMATRKRAGSFLALAQNPDLATEVTLQPLQRYALDAAILFSDILTVPDAMGLGLHFAEGEGPRFRQPLRTEADIDRLAVPDMARLRYVFDAVASIRRALAGSVPLIGFSGSPFTLACYMIDGQGGEGFPETKKLLYSRPDLMHRVLAVNAAAVSLYLNEQIRAGVQAVMVFDTWGGLLSDAAFPVFSLDYTRQVMGNLVGDNDGRAVPRIAFTKGGGQWLEAIAGCGCEGVGLDWTTDIGRARERIGNKVALQGNLDPAVLLSTPHAVESEAARILASFGQHPGHIFNLGHGIGLQTPPENVQVLVETVARLSANPPSSPGEEKVQNQS
jgi:uroporphyrinogen decarboxylase